MGTGSRHLTQWSSKTLPSHASRGLSCGSASGIFVVPVTAAGTVRSQEAPSFQEAPLHPPPLLRQAVPHDTCQRLLPPAPVRQDPRASRVRLNVGNRTARCVASSHTLSCSSQTAQPTAGVCFSQGTAGQVCPLLPCNPTQLPSSPEEPMSPVSQPGAADGPCLSLTSL